MQFTHLRWNKKGINYYNTGYSKGLRWLVTQRPNMTIYGLGKGFDSQFNLALIIQGLFDDSQLKWPTMTIQHW